MATRSKELRKVAEKFLDFLRKASVVSPESILVRSELMWFVFGKRAWLRRVWPFFMFFDPQLFF